MTYLKDNCGSVTKAKPCLSCRTPFHGCDGGSCSELSEWESCYCATIGQAPRSCWTPEEIRRGRKFEEAKA